MAKQTEKKPPVLKGVSAAERALAVLTAFRRGDGALSLAELGRADWSGQEHDPAARVVASTIPVAGTPA